MDRRRRRTTDDEGESVVIWTADHDWLAVLAAKIVGGQPNPRDRVGYAIRSWTDRHGWQRLGRIMARWLAAGRSMHPDEFIERMDMALDERLVPEPQPLPKVHDPANAQAIGLCAIHRAGHDSFYRTVLGGRILARSSMHPDGACEWCVYPVSALLDWCREFVAWCDNTPEGRSTIEDWFRKGRVERLKAIALAQSPEAVSADEAG